MHSTGTTSHVPQLDIILIMVMMMMHCVSKIQIDKIPAVNYMAYEKVSLNALFWDTQVQSSSMMP